MIYQIEVNKNPRVEAMILNIAMIHNLTINKQPKIQ
jgi:hypothetical protein